MLAGSRKYVVKTIEDVYALKQWFDEQSRLGASSTANVEIAAPSASLPTSND